MHAEDAQTVPAPLGELSPGRSIHAYCLWCCGGNRREVSLCPDGGCALWPWRYGVRPETRGLARRPDGETATEAIHARCRDCYEFPRKDCQVSDCQLYHVNRKRFCATRTASTRHVQRQLAQTRLGGQA